MGDTDKMSNTLIEFKDEESQFAVLCRGAGPEKDSFILGDIHKTIDFLWRPNVDSDQDNHAGSLASMFIWNSNYVNQTGDAGQKYELITDGYVGKLNESNTEVIIVVSWIQDQRLWCVQAYAEDERADHIDKIIDQQNQNVMSPSQLMTVH